MKLSINWLKQHLKTNSSPREIANTLTSLGIEVEGIVEYKNIFNKFIIGFVIDCEKHPNAERLKVCKVDVGTSVLQIVCGAPNVKSGLKVVVSLPGATLPDGTVITKTSIRGAESNGMICSEKELGVGNQSSGIMEIDQHAETGKSFSEFFFDDDTVLDISITPNRGDCTGVLGIARELEAKGVGKITTPFFSKEAVWTEISPEKLKINLLAPNAFSGVLVKEVNHLQAPDWMKKTMRSIGTNSINFIVDLSNYIMFLTGIPTHIYDADKVDGELFVKSMEKETPFTTLSGEEVLIPSGTRVVCDNSKVLCILGIMGGKCCAVDEKTKNIIIECAFTPLEQIVMSSKELHIQSEARYRTERGVDYSSIKNVVLLITNYITSIAGGRVASTNYQDNLNIQRQTIDYPLHNYKKITGLDIEADKAISILRSLGFDCTLPNNSTLAVTVPYHRHDFSGPEDITEEILRINNINSVPDTKLNFDVTLNQESLYNKNNEIKKMLFYKNYKEVVNYLFVEEALLLEFGLKTKDLKLKHPINNANTVQCSALPNLLKNLSHNIKQHGVLSLSLMESTTEYLDCQNLQNVFVAIKYGSKYIVGNSATEKRFDVFDIKSDMVDVLEGIYNYPAEIIDLGVVEVEKPYLHPFSSFEIVIDGIKIAEFGEIHPKTLEDSFDILSPVFFFKIFVDSIKKQKPNWQNNSVIKQQREISFIVDKSIKAREIMKTVKESDKRIGFVFISDVFLKDEVFGDKKKSITISFAFDMDKSLTKEDIMEIMQKIEKSVKNENGGELRGALPS